MKTHIALLLTALLAACGEAPQKFVPETKYGSKDPVKSGDSVKKPGPNGAETEDPQGDGKDPDDTASSGSNGTTDGTTKDPDGATKPDPNAPVNCKTFSWTSIKKPEDATCFTSIPEAFKALPESIKPFFILMRDSRSAQTSTIDKPRIIVTAPDGSFLLGAATDTTGRKDLEVAVYDYENSVWQFAGIDFSTNPPKIEKELCKTCHSAEPHPIWTRYGGWTGAFAQNNFLKDDEAAFLNKARTGSSEVSELFKNFKYRSSYSSGDRINPATKYYSGEENSQMLNYVAMQKAAQTTVGKMMKDSSISAADMMAMSAEISCNNKSGTMKKFGFSIEKNLRFVLEGTDKANDQFNGRFNASVYLAAELVAKAFVKDPALKDKFPAAVKQFADKRYGYFTGKSLADFEKWQAVAKTSVRNVMSDYLNTDLFGALKSSEHCSAIEALK